MANSDSYTWIGASGGSWDSAADWEDTTSGADPATSVPGSGNAVTIPGPTGSIYEVIDGGGKSASLGVTGYVDLVGAYGTGGLSVGSATGSPNSATFTTGGLTLGASSTLTATTANVIDGDLAISGTGAKLTASGAVTVGAPAGNDVSVAGQTYSYSSGASATLSVGAGGTLSAASLTVAQGTLSASGAGASVAVTGALTVGTAAAGTYAYPQTTPYYYSENGSVAVAGGASVTVGGAVAMNAYSSLTASGTGSTFKASGVLTTGAGQTDLEASQSGSIELGGLVVPAAASSGSMGNQSLFVSVDGSSTIEIGTAGGAAAGTLTIDAGQTVTLGSAATFDDATVDNGVIAETAGLSIGQSENFYGDPISLGGTGAVDLGANTTLSLYGAATAGLTLDFTGAGSTIAISGTTAYNSSSESYVYAPYAVGATLKDMATGDGIIVDNETLTNAVYAYSGANIGTLTLYAGTTAVETLTLAGNYTGRTFFISPTTSSGSAVLLLSNATAGSSPVSTTSDAYTWIGASGGSWDSAADWEDTTSGADPATSVPGSGNAVTIPGPTGSIYEVIDGGGKSASLGVTGYVDLVGAYGTGGLSVGSATGSPNSATFTTGGLTLGASSTLTATTANVIDGDLAISGTGAKLTASGAVTVGAPAGNDVSVAGQTYSYSSGASATLSVGAGGTLSAASLTVAQGTLSASGAGASVAVTGALTVGTAAAGTYAYPQTTPYYYSENGSVAVAGGASVTVGGAVAMNAYSSLTASGTGSTFKASGVLTTGAGQTDLEASQSGSIELGGLVVPAAASSGSMGNQSLFVSVDGSSTIEIGTAGGAAAGTLTIDAGQTVTLGSAATFDDATVDNGVIAETAGLSIGQSENFYGDPISLGGTGAVDLGANTTLSLYGAATAGLTLDFTGAGSTIAISGTTAYNSSSESYVYAPYAVGATLKDMATGDGIIVDNETLTNAVYAYSGANIGTLTLYAGTTAVETLTLAGNYTGRTFFISPTTSSGSAVLLLSNATAGSSPVSTTSDAYTWIGASGGSWDSAADWEDTTSGADPATSVPGSGNAVTIPGPTGSIYEVIDGGGKSASLGVTGYVDLVGAYGTGGLSVGSATGSPNSATFTTGGLTLGASSTLTATTANVIDGDLAISGTGAKLTASGAVTVGAPAGNDVSVAGQTYSYSSGASATLSVGAGGTLSAASLTVAQGTLSASGAGASVAVTGALTVGTAAAGTYAYPQTTPYYYSENGSVAVAGGASVTVGGAVAMNAYSSLTASGTGSTFKASGVLTTGAGQTDLEASQSGSIELGGLVVPAAASSGSMGNQSLFVSVDGSSTIEIGTAGGAAAGTLTIDAGQTVTLGSAATFDDATVDNGVIAETAGLSIGQSENFYGDPISLGGTGAVDLGANTTLSLYGAATAGLTLDFTGAGSTIAISGTTAYNSSSESYVYAPYAVGATLKDMATGDGIIVDNETLTNAVYAYSGANIGTLTLYAGTTAVETLTLAGNYTGRTFFISPTTSSGSAVELLARPGTTVPTSEAVLAGIATPLTGFAVSDGNAQATSITVSLTDTNGDLSASGAGGGTVTGSGTASLKISGTASQVDAALATLSFESSTTGTDTIDVTAVDSLGSVALAAGVPVTVLPIAAPTIAVPTGQLVEQPATSGKITSVSITYPDGAVSGEQVSTTLSDTAGDLSANTTAAGGGGTVSGSGTNKLTISGTLAEVDADLSTLSYIASASGADTVTVSASGTHGGAAKSASFAVVTAGQPSIAAPASATVDLNKATAIGGVSIAETPAIINETFTVKVSDANGLLSASGSNVSGSNTNSLTISGSLGQVNSALATLADVDAKTASDTITLSVTDSYGGAAGPKKIAVTVDAIPTVTEALADDTGSHTPNVTSNDELQGTADPDATIDFTIDGAAATATAAANASGVWTFTPSGLADGQHTIVASETNSADETGSTSLSFLLDTKPPTLTLYPDLDMGQASGGEVAVTANGTDFDFGSGVATIAVYSGSVAPGNFLGDATGTNGLWTLATSIPSGTTPTLVVVATDVAGNATTVSATYQPGDAELEIYKVGPPIQFVPTLTPVPHSGTQYTLNLGTVSQGSGSQTITLDINNGAPGFPDILEGTLTPTSGSGLTISGADTFTLAGGQLSPLQTISFSASAAGTFSETFTLALSETNSSGVTTSLGSDTLVVTGTVTSLVGPDLAVTAITAPSTGVAGQQAIVAWTVTNSGNAAADGPWIDDVYLASDAGGDNPVLLGSFAFDGTLAAGASITRTQAVTLPSTTSGDSYFVVRTDADDQVYENPGAPDETSVATTATNITPLASADVVVTSVTAPVDALAGQQTQVSWIVSNQGTASTGATSWSDQVYLSPTPTLSYGLHQAINGYLLATLPNVSYLAPGDSYSDSATVAIPKDVSGPFYIVVVSDAGASAGSAQFAVDLPPLPALKVTSVQAPPDTFSGQPVTLSWTVANAGSGATDVSNWTDAVYISSDGALDANSILLGDFAHSGALAVGGSYTKSATVTTPVGISGNYQLFVVADVDDQIDQGPTHGTDDGDTAIEVNLTPPPQLDVTFASTPTTAKAGQPVSVTYNVANVGASITPNTSWTDNLYVSSDPTIDGSSVLIQTATHYGALDVGQSYSVTATANLPTGISGDYYLIVETDGGDQVFQVDRSEDVATSGAIAVANPLPELVVSDVTAPATVASGHQAVVSWQVTNQGPGATGAVDWTDNIVLSASGVLGASDNITLATVQDPGALAPGSSYTQSAVVNVPITLSGAYTLFVVADAGDAVAETNPAGSASTGSPITAVQSLAELDLTSVTAPGAATAGDDVTVGWTVKNDGAAATDADYWFDNVFVSSTPSLSGGVEIGSFEHTNALASGASYSASDAVQLPANLAAGTYYIVVETDAGQNVDEAAGASVVSVSGPITVAASSSSGGAGSTVASGGSTSPSDADLTATDVTAPSQTLSGQTFSASWTIANDSGAAQAGGDDLVYLSLDQVIDSTDYYLGSVSQSALAAGASQNFTETFQIPAGLSGSYYVLVAPDEETTSLANVGASAAVAVDLPPSGPGVALPSLAVSSVTAGATTVAPGASLSISYTVQDQGAGDADGDWSDAVYLSTTPEWTTSAVLLGNVQHSGGLAAGASYTGTFGATVPGLAAGNYYVIVRPDILGAVPEATDANGAGASTQTISVSLPTLALNTPVSGLLSNGQTQYYAIDATAGETIKLSLTSNVPGAVNNLYVRYGAVPTLGQFVASSSGADVADPTVTFQATQTGTYYVMVDANSVDGTESYALEAAPVAFSISAITPDSGSNLGSVTLTIDGAQLQPGDQAEVVAPDGQTVAATKVQWVDGTQMYATFDLQGLSTGTYSVEIQDGSQTSTLSDSFQVTDGPVGQLAVSLSTPQYLRIGDTGAALVTYTNTGDTDVAVPVLDISSDGSTLVPAGSSGTGSDDIIELDDNPSGPAGIVQPGQSVTAVYLISPTSPTPHSIFDVSVGGLTPGVAINWSSLEGALQPPTVDATDWSNVWAEFLQRVGGTTTSLESALSADATELAAAGDPTTDIPTLIQYELLQATGGLQQTPLTSVTDIAATGALGLSLTRTYDGTLLNRNQVGLFGEGWTSTYDVSAVTDSSGDVYVSGPAGVETFTLQDGAYVDAGGDDTLTVVNGLYVLTDASGDVTRFLANGRLGSVTDANGDTLTANWSGPDLQSVVSSDGETLTFTSNAAGCITSATDSDGQTVTYSYNAAGTQLLSADGPDGETSYGYAPEPGPIVLGLLQTGSRLGAQLDANALTSITNPDGVTQTFTYDDAGRLASQGESGGSGQVTYSYPSSGEVVETDASGDKTTLLYDTDGQVAVVDDSLGDNVQLTYNAEGELTRAVGPNGAVYTYAYDAQGNLTSYTDPQGDTVTASYAPGTSNLTTFTDQNGDAINYSYNAAGDVTGVTYADGSGTTYQYGANGQLTSSTDAADQTTTYAFDASGNLTKETFADGTSQSYTYNAAGELTSATATDGGVTNYTYNAAGDLTSETNPQGQVLSYAYNAAGELSRLTDPNGAITNYAYNATGLLTSMTDGSGDLIESYSYDADNQLVGEKMGNGASTSYSYNADGAVTEILSLNADGSTASDYRYSYNDAGEVTGVATTDGTWSYGYDSLGELTSADFASTNPSIQNQTIAYVYDAAGNRVSVVDDGVVTNYTTNDLDQYTKVGDTTYTYNADGDMTSAVSPSGTTTYAYNDANELTSVTSPTGTTSYVYDALGNVVSTTTNGVVSDDIINPLAIDSASTGPLAALAQVYDASGNVTATYDYGANGLAAVGGDTGLNYEIEDRLGNITAISGSGGEITNSYFYAPFGSLITSNGDPSTNFSGFGGGFGANTGDDNLINMRARYYDSDTGRFITRDPLGITAGPNYYNYAYANPIDNVDLSGLATLQGQIGFTFDFFEAVGQYQYGIAIDDSGNIAIFQAYGGGLAPGLQVSGAVGGAYSNANTIDGLLGPFVNASVTAGAGASASADAFYGDDNGRPVVGAGASYGIGAGAEAGVTLTNTEFIARTNISSILNWLKQLFENQQSGAQSDPVENVTPQDPNAIVGPTGFGPQNAVGVQAPLAYSADFQNEASASAPAQDVTVTEQLDANLDWRTFRLTAFGFDGQTYVLSGSQAFYSTTIDLSATKGYDVFVSAGVNVQTGVVTWSFDTIDPATGEAPTNPEVGFLPVDDGTGIGDGFVSYTIQAKSTDATGTTIGAQAQVVFDNQPPLDTAEISNTIDAVAPTSAVAALPAHTADTQFEVDWSGTDDPQGSGIASYTILVSTNGGPATAWLTKTTLTNAIFTGADGDTYAFSSIATDNAGNVETPHATPDTTIEIGTAAPTGLALTAASDTGASDTDDITRDNTPTVTGLAEDGASVTLYDGAAAVGSAVANATTGVWSITATLLADGVHTLTAAAVNATGLASPESEALSIEVDTTAPVVTIANASGTTTNPSQTITGTVDAADAGTTVTVLDGATVLTTALVAADGSWSADVTLSGARVHVITATDTDIAGNTGASNAVDITLGSNSLTVAQYIANPGAADQLAGGFVIVDKASAVLTIIDQLNADPHLQAIDLTNAGTPTLALTPAEALNDATALSKIAGAYAVSVNGTIRQRKSVSAGTFQGVSYTAYVVDYDATGFADLTRFYNASGTLLASESFTAGGGDTIAVGGRTIERKVEASGTFRGVSYTAYVVDYDATGLADLTRFYNASGTLLASESFTAGGGDTIAVGGRTIERKVEASGTFRGVSYTAYVVDYDATGFADLTRFYNASGTLLASESFTAGGGDTIAVGGRTIERKVEASGTFRGVSYTAYVVDYDATGFADLTRFYNASGTLLASESFTAGGGDTIAVGGRTIERKVEASGTFRGVSYTAYVVDYDATGLADLTRFYNASGTLLASESFTADGGDVIAVGGRTIERKVEAAGTFRGVSYTAYAVDYDATGFADLTRFYNAGGTLLASESFTADGGDTIAVGGRTIERKVEVSGTFRGVSYTAYVVDYDATGFADLTRYYNASGKLLASETMQSNGGYSITVQSELLQRKVVDVDGSYSLSSYDITGQSYTSAETLFEAGGLRAAQVYNNTDGTGALTLLVSNGSISITGTTLSVTLKADTPDTNSDSFSLGFHSTETINATGTSNNLLQFAAASGSGQTAWQDTINGFVAAGAGADEFQFSAASFGASNGTDAWNNLLSAATTNSAGWEVIHDNAHDTLLLNGVSYAALVASRNDFKFV